MTQAFQLTPGTILQFEEIISENTLETKRLLKWEVFTDAVNQTYIYCAETESFAYFVNNGTLLYFTDFVGNRSSSLYAFYVGCHKVLLGYYSPLTVKDAFPIIGFYNGFLKILQDFVAPFYLFLKTDYQSEYTEIDAPGLRLAVRGLSTSGIPVMVAHTPRAVPKAGVKQRSKKIPCLHSSLK